jgi:hypothetical protein
LRAEGTRRGFAAERVGCIGLLARLWHFAYHSFVFFVRSDPEPNNFFTLKNAHSSMSSPDTYKIDRLCWMNFFEAKTWMTGIGLETPISFAGLLLHLHGQLLEIATEARR